MKKPMTEAQKRLVQLDLQKQQIDAYYELLDSTIKEVRDEVGLDGMFQDDSGIVYQIVKPKGTFTHFKDLDFVRTRRPDERAGSLSVKKAEEAGFTVK